jgi:uncharacterized protein (DUF2141 family)
MKRIVFAFTLVMALYVNSIVFAQDNCTLSGEVVYSGDSNIYVCLHTSKSFATFKKELPPPGFVQIVKANASGKAPFAFMDVPKGEYLVHVFVDENKNGKFDCDTWGYSLEPSRMFKPPADGMHPNWYEQKFVVDEDVTGIVVKLRD